MTMPKFSANLGFLWPERPLLERIDAAATAGFKAVELHWPYAIPAESVKQACASRRLTLLGINTPPGNLDNGDFGLGAVAGRQSDFLEGFETAARWARLAGASSIHVMAGVVQADGKAAAVEVFRENLSIAAAKAPDLTLLLEPINQRDKPGYFYSTLGEAAALIDAVGATNIKIMFDVYHVGISEGDILTRLDSHMGQIGHVQIAAVPSRAEPDEGEIAYGAIFKALDRLNYGGWVGCEYKPRGDTDEGLAWTGKLGISL